MAIRKDLLFPAALFVASVGCFGFSSWGLAQGAPKAVYGADNCQSDCTENDPLVINECRHLNGDDNPPNDCQADKCTKNIIFRAHCTAIAEGSDCLFTPPFPGTWVTQERRNATNCTTTNPTTWTPHNPGACEWFHSNETRCETGACDGDKWADDLTRTDDLRYCSH